MNPCKGCGKLTKEYNNYCSWNCHVDHAKRDGAIVHTPNGLPIRCMTSDGKLLEHEHGDHPDYKFPVEIEYAGPETDDVFSYIDGFGNKYPMTPEEIGHSKVEIHALVYANESVAVTMYETCSAMWYMNTGKLAGGILWGPNKWRLSEASREKIKNSLKR